MKTLLKTIGIVSTLIGSSFLFQNCSEKESIPEGIIPPTDSVSSKIEIKSLRHIPVMAQTGNRFLPIRKNDIDYRECRRLKHSRYCRHDSQRCSILRK